MISNSTQINRWGDPGSVCFESNHDWEKKKKHFLSLFLSFYVGIYSGYYTPPQMGKITIFNLEKIP